MHHWPDKDDRSIVTEMLNDSQAPAWQACRAFLLKKCIKKGYPDPIREDIVQETLIKVLRYLGNFAYKYPLVVWLGIVLTTTAIDFARKERREKANVSLNALQNTGEEGCEVAIEISTPEDDTLVREKICEAVTGCCKVLEEGRHGKRNVEICRRYYLQSQSVKEIAEDLQIKEHTVYQVLRKARKYFLQFHRKD